MRVKSQVSQGGVGKSKTSRTGEPRVRSVGHCSRARPTPQVITRSKSSTRRTSLMSGVVVGLSDVAPVYVLAPVLGFTVDAFWKRTPNSALPSIGTGWPLGPDSELLTAMR